MSITRVRWAESAFAARALLFFLVAALPFGGAYGQFKRDPRDNRPIEPSTRLRMFAVAESPSIKAGSRVLVKITLKNVTEKAVSMGDSSPSTDYDAVVVDALGNEPPRTEWGLKKLNGDIATLRNTELRLEPGQEVHAVYDITEVFRLTKPGVYNAQLTRFRVWPETVEDAEKFIEVVRSNPFQFTIVP